MNSILWSETFALVSLACAYPHTVNAEYASAPQLLSSIIPVEHITIHTGKPYSDVKAAIEGRLGHLDEHIRTLLVQGKIDELRTALEKAAGQDGLVIHYVAVHGDWLALNSGRSNGIVYHIRRARGCGARFPSLDAHDDDVEWGHRGRRLLGSRTSCWRGSSRRC